MVWLLGFVNDDHKAPHVAIIQGIKIIDFDTNNLLPMMMFECGREKKNNNPHIPNDKL